MWPGFCNALVRPSPKLHSHAVGLPVVLSVNCTIWLAVGAASKENDAFTTVKAGVATDDVAVFVPPPQAVNRIKANSSIGATRKCRIVIRPLCRDLRLVAPHAASLGRPTMLPDDYSAIGAAVTFL